MHDQKLSKGVNCETCEGHRFIFFGNWWNMHGNVHVKIRPKTSTRAHTIWINWERRDVTKQWGLRLKSWDTIELWRHHSRWVTSRQPMAALLLRRHAIFLFPPTFLKRGFPCRFRVMRTVCGWVATVVGCGVSRGGHSFVTKAFGFGITNWREKTHKPDLPCPAEHA